MNSPVITVSREELYEQIWQEPMTKVAPKFGLSDVGLAKACKRYNIPRPPVGYWAKKEYGKAPPQTPLPPMTGEMSQPIRFLPEEEKPKPIPLRTNADRVTDEKLKVLIANEERPENQITIPERITRLHSLVSSTKDAFTGVDTDHQGLCSPRWDYKGLTLSISVGKQSIPRALRIMDTLVKGLEKRGYKFAHEKDRHHETLFVEIQGEKFRLSLREKRKMIRLTAAESEKTWGRVRYEANGLLELEACPKDWDYSAVRWTETETRRLDDRLNGIVIDLLVAVENERLRRQRAREAEVMRREAEVRRWKQEQEQRDLEKKIAELDSIVDRWANAGRIRAFVTDVYETHRKHNSIIEDGSELGEWLNWALRHADSIDPLGLGRRPKEEHVETGPYVRPGHPR